MTQFSISAACYPLWAFTGLVVMISVPLAFPIHGFYRYILGLSAPNWMRRTGLGSSPIADPDTSFQEHRSAAKRPLVWGYSEPAPDNNSPVRLSSNSEESRKGKQGSKR